MQERVDAPGQGTGVLVWTEVRGFVGLSGEDEFVCGSEEFDWCPLGAGGTVDRGDQARPRRIVDDPLRGASADDLVEFLGPVGGEVVGAGDIGGGEFELEARPQGCGGHVVG
ncbi:hypothetical protein AB0E01_44880 [Nocardia vinacea]|uniref:hypothetical protein n=1 Tax=Nocardia vinacea TaxID=96468 RepID=UPI0033DFA812